MEQAKLDAATFDEWLRDPGQLPAKTYPVDYSDYSKQPDFLRESLAGYSTGLQALSHALKSKLVLDRGLACYLIVRVLEGDRDEPPPITCDHLVAIVDLPPPSLLLLQVDMPFFAYNGWLALVRTLAKEAMTTGDGEFHPDMEGVWVSYAEPTAQPKVVQRTVVLGAAGIYDKFISKCIGEHDESRRNEFLR